jgi:diacylglycerol kinase family enzyme
LDIPLGILLLGALNHFARDLGLLLDLEGRGPAHRFQLGPPGRCGTRLNLESVEISVRQRRHVRVALNGESLFFRPPLHYRIRPRAMRVIAAEPASS